MFIMLHESPVNSQTHGSLGIHFFVKKVQKPLPKNNTIQYIFITFS